MFLLDMHSDGYWSFDDGQPGVPSRMALYYIKYQSCTVGLGQAKPGPSVFTVQNQNTMDIQLLGSLDMSPLLFYSAF